MTTSRLIPALLLLRGLVGAEDEALRAYTDDRIRGRMDVFDRSLDTPAEARAWFATRTKWETCKGPRFR
jgi:hypothetical protein